MNIVKENIAMRIYPVKYTTESCNEQSSYFTGSRFTKLALLAN